MKQNPLALLNPYGHRRHEALTGGQPVSRFPVHMTAPQAVEAVIAVPGTMIRRDDGPAAMAADEGFFSDLVVFQLSCSFAGHVVLRALVLRSGHSYPDT